MTWRVQLVHGVGIRRDLRSLSQVDPRLSLRFLGIRSHSPANSQVGIGNEDFSDASVCDRIPQCGYRHPIQANPICGIRVVPVAAGLPGSHEEGACDSEPVCHISHRNYSVFVPAWDPMTV